MPGASDPVYLASRRALLDVLAALGSQASAVVLVGAHAVYLHTGGAAVALAEFTKDADIAFDPSLLTDEPLIEVAMLDAGFTRQDQPGIWESSARAQVDLLVPESVAGGSGRRGVSLPPHDGHAMRRVRGLEGALVENAIHELAAIDPGDDRVARVRVAGPTALIVSKAHKLHERLATPPRLLPKDAHDIYRLLVAVETEPLARAMKTLISTPLSAEVSNEALQHLAELFATPHSVGSELAGRAEADIGQPETVAVASSALANELLSACR